jgi:hypothetical protein
MILVVQYCTSRQIDDADKGVPPAAKPQTPDAKLNDGSVLKLTEQS